MLSKSQIAAELADRGLGGKVQITNILNGLAELAVEEIAQGEDFTVPGIVAVKWSYTAPRLKGEMYLKGQTYVGFGGVEQTADADSKARKAKVLAKASLAAPIKRVVPTRSGAEDFAKTKVGKAVARAKARG